MKIASQLIEVFKSLMPSYNASEGIYEYGNGNSYPEYVKWLIDNSITAHTASNMMTNFVAGKPFDNQNDDKFINKLNEFKIKLAKQITDYKGWAINVKYNLAGQVTDFDIIPFHHCRVGKKDDRKYNGKIITKTNWGDSKEKPLIFDVYNTDKKVIAYQFEKQGKDYKGQLLYGMIDSSSEYPNSRIHAVINDCESEIQAGKFKNNSLKRGFFGKQIFITPPFVDSLLTPETDPERYRNAVSERDEFKENLQQFMGVDNVGNVLHLEMEFNDEEDINKKIVIKNIATDINDKLFEYTEKSVMDKIVMAFNNIPKVLISNPDSAFFSQSGELYKQAQITYQNNTEQERGIVESIINELLKGMGKETINIIPLIDEQ